ncbi:probable tubulin polyglutamylase TTLL2 [Kryptolebias marmoratus]|uniref:probable tubulin polyglutamylase TTLL2 n=1 Tax=Kryptolebias marmoratus TaxID=37003 RepID=UPI000D530701|nr:probable tubulin polyglutamylase TTLL2 [Kryptolebias marmoratus]
MAASLVFRLHDRGPELVREVLLERGWEEYDGRKQEEEDWNLYWRGSTFRSSEYHNLLPWQRLNHHPKTAGITRKDSLVRNLRRMRATFGSSLYDFSPTTFILPNDFTRFLAEFNKLRLTSGPAVYWICKPVDLSRGRGIFIFEDIKDLVYDCSVIVQRYISSPLLISGYKFDLRIYVCVKSFHPLTVYIHQEGLVRFATEKYNLTSLSNLFAHLTNTSINKFGPFYKSEKGRVGQGCKWTMSKFRHFLRSQDINEVFLWQRINNIITLTLLTIAPTVPSCPNCVELFGFDVLIDSKFKPWLLEVNYSPALTLDCQADVSVKKGLIGDLIDLMNYTSTDSLRVRAYQKHRHRQPCFNTLPLLSTLKQNRIQKKKKHKKTSQTRPVKTNQSRHFAVADNQRYLPPVAARYRSVNTNKTLNWILGPHSKTNESVVNRQTSPALTACQIKKGLQDPEVRNHNNTEMELSEEAPDTLSRGSKFRASADSWRLPNISRGSQGPIKSRVGGPAALNAQHIPPVRVGGFIRTFPFNAATLKASQHEPDVTTIIQELQKLTGRLASCQLSENMRTREESAGKDCFGSLLWGPKDPSMLGRCFKPS